MDTSQDQRSKPLLNSSGLKDVESEVLRRYSDGACAPQPELCCPIEYEPQYLDKLPREIIEKDYGCGDPSRYVNEGETVVDLGSGAGKICYILSQRVGSSGKIIGVDFNDDMLALARKYQDEMAEKLGYGNVRFVKGKIQDLGLDLDKVQAFLDKHPVKNIDDLNELEAERERLRTREVMIRSDSVDVVVSNCVLNLVRPRDKTALFSELFRVLKRGGRAVISDIVSDENPTPDILEDPELWSGCISGAFREDAFLEMFIEAGFYGVEIMARQEEPWRVINGIEFRSMTVRAYKGKEGPCLERNQAVIYKGPWKSVTDDDGHTFLRGERMALCDKTFKIMTDTVGPYGKYVVPIEPLESIPLREAGPFDCDSNALRSPRQTKGLDYNKTITDTGDPSCEPDCC